VQLESHNARGFQTIPRKAVSLDSAGPREVGWCNGLRNLGNRDALRE